MLGTDDGYSDNGWRIKLYILDTEGAWLDQGTGFVDCKFPKKLSGPAIVVTNEESTEILLQSKVQCEDIYERQGSSIIMWRENDERDGDIDYALSFQDTSGCEAIWEAISQIQGQYLQQRSYATIPSFYRESDMVSWQLPQCSLQNLQSIRDTLQQVQPQQRESFARFVLENDATYIRQLTALFTTLDGGQIDDIEGGGSLAKIAEIHRYIVFLNDVNIIELLMSPECYLSTAGALEYDPSLRSRGNYRQFLSEQATFKQVIPIDNEELKKNIEQLFRLRYLRDFMIRPTIDETGVSALNSLIQFSTTFICTQMFDDEDYLRKIIGIINDSYSVDNAHNGNENIVQSSSHSSSSGSSEGDASVEDATHTSIVHTKLERRDHGLGFLRELFFMSRGIGAEKRASSFATLMSGLRAPLIATFLHVLADPGSSPFQRACVAEVLANIAMTHVGSLWQAIMEGPVPTFPPHIAATRPQQQLPSQHNNSCLLYLVIRHMVVDSDVAIIEQFSDTLKLLLDPDRLDKREKEKCLSVFYDHYIHWLLEPFVEPHQPELPTDPSSPQDMSAIFASRKFILEIFCLCVSGHAYRMKYFILRNNVIGRVSKLLLCENKTFHLGAIRMLRTIIAAKDEFYYRHIVKFDLMKPVITTFQSNHSKDNLVNSAIAEMLQFVREESISTLIEYIVEKYYFEGPPSVMTAEDADDRAQQSSSSERASTDLVLFAYSSVFAALKLRYDQMKDISAGREGLGSSVAASSDGGGVVWGAVQQKDILRNQKFAERDNEEAYFFDDSDDNDNDNESAESSSSGNIFSGPSVGGLGLGEERIRKDNVEDQFLSSRSAPLKQAPSSGDYPNGSRDSSVWASTPLEPSTGGLADSPGTTLPPLKSKFEDDDIPSSAFFKGSLSRGLASNAAVIANSTANVGDGGGGSDEGASVNTIKFSWKKRKLT